MKLTVVATEFPYPPIHGGRSDVWQRLRAMADADVSVQLICWHSPRRGGSPLQEDIDAVRRVVSDLIIYGIRYSPAAMLRRLLMLPWLPSHASARMVWSREWRDLLSRVRSFAPDAIWLDGIWGADIARRLSRHLSLPLFVRSHNIEHRYMRTQVRLTKSIGNSLAWHLTTVGLERFETRVLRESAAFFDISVDDLGFWKDRGLTHGYWMPPIVRMPDNPGRASPDRVDFDLAFLGNLHTPNNVEGVLWFLTRVWPLILEKRAGTTAVIAGSAPLSTIREACSRARGVTLRPDPPDVWRIYRSARVLFNPLLHGSGVNIKTAEMLFMNVPIVTTPVGIQGLPQEVVSAVQVAGTPEEFAGCILAALTSSTPALERSVRERAREFFRPTSIRQTLAVLRSHIGVTQR